MAKRFCPICGEERAARVDSEEAPAIHGAKAPRRVYRCEVCNSVIGKEDIP